MQAADCPEGRASAQPGKHALNARGQAYTGGRGGAERGVIASSRRAGALQRPRPSLSALSPAPQAEHIKNQRRGKLVIPSLASLWGCAPLPPPSPSPPMYIRPAVWSPAPISPTRLSSFGCTRRPPAARHTRRRRPRARRRRLRAPARAVQHRAAGSIAHTSSP